MNISLRKNIFPACITAEYQILPYPEEDKQNHRNKDGDRAFALADERPSPQDQQRQRKNGLHICWHWIFIICCLQVSDNSFRLSLLCLTKVAPNLYFCSSFQLCGPWEEKTKKLMVLASAELSKSCTKLDCPIA